MAKRKRYLLYLIQFWILLPICINAQDADHILLTRVITQPDAAESISIYNPTNSPINLSDYYICDDKLYYKIQMGEDLSPSNPYKGFTARFPSVDIPAEDTLHIVLNENYSEFYGVDFVPDLFMYGDDDNSMLETEIGSIGLIEDKLKETSELIILFKWDGTNGNLIQDIDYFSWSSLSGINYNGIDKSGESTYKNDTTVENQLYFQTVADQYYAYSRIDSGEETSEPTTGGNGISGHDETSENFRESWEIIKLFYLGCTNPDGLNYDSNAEVDDGSCYFTTISEILNDSEIIGQQVITAGIISDYYKPSNGPHIISIAEDSSGFIIELSIWDNNWTDEWEELFEVPPYLTNEIQVKGIVAEYETKLQIEPTSFKILNENYEFQAPKIKIDSISGGDYDGRIVSCNGILVDYFDVTVYDGPHALTIENDQGYRLELSIWPNTYDITNSSYSYLLQPPYDQYYLSVIGSVGEYDGEKQLSISGSNSITVTDTMTTEGVEYSGLMVKFIIDDVVNEAGEFEREEEFKTDLADQLGINKGRISIVNMITGSVIININISERVTENNTEPSNDILLAIIPEMKLVGEFYVEVQEILNLSVNSAIIKPEPYVIIPTLGEKLDFTYSYPNNSRVIIRLFDLSGRFITSLVDEYYEDSSTVFRDSDQSSWDGRDHLGQIVSPGTYIIHIETMNPVTGATSMDAAPVVVGVKN